MGQSWNIVWVAKKKQKQTEKKGREKIKGVGGRQRIDTKLPGGRGGVWGGAFNVGGRRICLTRGGEKGNKRGCT